MHFVKRMAIMGSAVPSSTYEKQILFLAYFPENKPKTEFPTLGLGLDN